MIVDFNEIAAANSSDGKQDEFELFARDFVEAIGFNIISQPDRGQDGGKDLLISETLSGIRKSSQRTWLVSVKHFSPSGKSVGVSDETNIRDRVEKHGADGFFGFYSTLPSSGFSQTLKGLSEKLDIDYLDKGLIQSQLITNPILENVFRAYFPKSYEHFLSIGGYPAISKDIHTSFIGGDSVPSIRYGINSEGSILPNLTNWGTYTIYDLDVIIKHSSERGGYYILRQTLPFLHPKSNNTCNSFNIKKVIDIGFIHSQIYARNGVFFQSTKLAKYQAENSTDFFYSHGDTTVHKESHDSKGRELLSSQKAPKIQWREEKKYILLD